MMRLPDVSAARAGGGNKPGAGAYCAGPCTTSDKRIGPSPPGEAYGVGVAVGVPGTGVRVTVGGIGVWVTVPGTGVRVTVGVPGTGVFVGVLDAPGVAVRVAVAVAVTSGVA